MSREAMAGRWIGYVLGWAGRQRPVHLDWEQAAIDGLFNAIQSQSGLETEKHWIDWHLRGARANLLRRSRTARSAQMPLEAGEQITTDSGGPAQIAALRDEAQVALAGIGCPWTRLYLTGQAYDGLTFSEIARSSGISRQAVVDMMSRNRKTWASRRAQATTRATSGQVTHSYGRHQNQRPGSRHRRRRG